jgi:hypothetical protein
MEHQHQWQPCAVLYEPGRVCDCGQFEQITKRHFKELFKRSFWKWAKWYADKVMHGGYPAWKRHAQEE